MINNRIKASTKTGSHHWIMQRISAIALIPLSMWFIWAIAQILRDQAGLVTLFVSPINAIAGILFIIAALYHATLGMRVIIEDYISNKAKRHTLIILNNFVAIASGAAAIISILELHQLVL